MSTETKSEDTANDSTTLKMHMFTDCIGEDGDTNVLVYTRLPLEILANALRHKQFKFNDCFTVRADEVQYYLFESTTVDSVNEPHIRKLAEQFKRSGE